jgi:protein-disulfide isomerase
LAAVLFASVSVFASRAGSINAVDITGFNPAMGSKEAPVTLVVFGKFDCRYTGQFFTETLPQLEKEYIDSGRVRIVYRNAFTPEGLQASQVASLCVNEQGKFWEYAPELFKNTSWIQNANSSLYEIARKLGLDAAAFSDCMANGAQKANVEDDYRYWDRLGLNGTPTIFVNGIRIDGLPPIEDLEGILSKFNY